MPERPDCQQPALDLLRDVHGYTVIRGKDLTEERGGEGEPWLRGRLASALIRINPGLTSSAANQAIASLQQPAGADLLEANEACHIMLSRWVSVEEAASVPGQAPLRRSVQFFDFENIDNNEFLAVDELTLRGPSGESRFDIVLYVNGLPLTVIECKDPADKHAMSKAVTDLLGYQKLGSGVPRFFHTIHLCIALARHDARYGTVTTGLDHYSFWKSQRPHSKSSLEQQLNREVTTQDTLLAGLCDPANLLDCLRNFCAFERQGGRVIKKLARYQQWEAVRDAATRCEDSARGTMKDRGGVIWHTQGSGKSLSMLWLALRLKRSRLLANPTLLIITDRKGLDSQITRTFRNCGFENPVSAKSSKHLEGLLNGQGGRTIITTVQKFQDGMSTKKQPDNVIAMIDEAHRTEYGVFNARLRKCLPTAALIGFTGTPIPKTVAKFGSYIHRYTMPQSVSDGATVPILYESRLPDLAVWGNRLDPLFEAEFPELNEEQKEKVKKQEVTARKIAEAPDRIEMIALDIVKHYQENFEPDGFKAQLAACSQKSAAEYYKILDRLLPGRCAVLLSDPPKHAADLWELKKKFADEEEMIRQFTEDDADKLAIIIVVDKYLTGFDAPIERVLYLDKPLQEHNLLQAIARVNRPYPKKDKQWGLVVDYWGVAGFLDQALKGLHEDLPDAPVMERRDSDDVFTTLRGRHAAAFESFPDGLEKSNIEPWILALEKEDTRAVFLGRYRSFYKALEQLLPDPRALDYLADFAWLRRVRKETENYYQEEDLSIPDCSNRVRELIARSIKGDQIIPLLKPINILSSDFEQEMDKLRSDRAKALRMRHAVKHTITIHLNEDPVLYESLRERLERIIADRKASRFDDIAEFKLLTGIAGEIKTQQQASGSHLVSEEARPFFHALTKAVDGDLSGACVSEGPPDELLTDLATEVLKSLRSLAVIDWRKKADVQRDMRRSIKRKLRMNYAIPSDQVEPLTLVLMDLARIHLK